MTQSRRTSQPYTSRQVSVPRVLRSRNVVLGLILEGVGGEGPGV